MKRHELWGLGAPGRPEGPGVFGVGGGPRPCRSIMHVLLKALEHAAQSKPVSLNGRLCVGVCDERKTEWLMMTFAWPARPHVVFTQKTPHDVETMLVLGQTAASALAHRRFEDITKGCFVRGDKKLIKAFLCEALKDEGVVSVRCDLQKKAPRRVEQKW